MSSEALIYIETGDGEFPEYRGNLCGVTVDRISMQDHSSGLIPRDAQFQIDTMARFYEESNTPFFGFILMNLLSSPNVSSVWIGPDDRPDIIEKVTEDEVLRVIQEFLEDCKKSRNGRGT